MTRIGLSLFIASCAVGGCKSPTTLSEEVPAILVETNDASREALQTVLVAIFNRRVLVAPDALTRNSVLMIEQRPPKSLRNRPAQGRIMQAPIQLKLVTDGTQCILIDRRSQSRHVLSNSRCVAE